MNQLSRQERQRQRLRGAGRSKVDSAPVVFQSRRALQDVTTRALLIQNTVGQDILVPLSAAKVNASSARKAKRTSKIMDFRTPKSTRKTPSKRKTPARSPPKIAPLEALVSEDIQIDSILTSTPVTMDGFQDTRLVCPTPSNLAAEMQAIDDEIPCDIEPQSQTPQATLDSPTKPASSRKRKLLETDIEVPLKSTPEPKPRKKLRGLLRELGPGASRFLIGAPNFATPARRQSISIVRIVNVNGKPQVSSRRVSQRLVASEMRELAKVLKRTAPAKVQKSCAQCQGTKAWRRWHAIEDGVWHCHKCFSPSSVAPPKKARSQTKNTTTRTARSAYTLTDDELSMVYARRATGVTFNAIARELGKWKTGQSVKNYLARHVSAEAEARLTSKLSGPNTAKAFASSKTRRPRKTKAVTQVSTSRLAGVMVDCDI